MYHSTVIPETCLALALAAADAKPILTPVGYQVAAIEREDGTEVATLLMVHTSALDTSKLSEAQALEWKGLKSRIVTQYGDADRRGRARLILELLKLESDGRRHDDYSVWVRFPAGETTHTETVFYPHEGSLWRVTDPTTGQYAAIVKYEDTSRLLRIFDEMFADKTHADVMPKVKPELHRLAAQSEALVEVDGQREYVAKGQATPAALASELNWLLPNLYGDGRSRILETIAIMSSFRDGALKADEPALTGEAGICAAPCDAKGLPLPAIATTLKVHGTAHPFLRLEPVDEAVAKEFFEDGECPLPDLDLSFPDQVRKLLSTKE
jgi:hypothetical protein